MQETYFDNQDITQCSGCGLCVDVCPKKCITLQMDNCGFYYPVVDETVCIHCNLCKNKCTNVNVEIEKSDVAYAAVNKNQEEVGKSASGGMFLVLADYVLKQGGYVAGVEYSEGLKVGYNLYNTKEDCYKFCGSKYLKAELNDIYNRVMQVLKEGKKVLFTGSSCQVNAMKMLAKDYKENLITCDIICHATPSPKIFELYVKNLEDKYKKKVTGVFFRTKKNGWRDQTPLITFEDGTEVFEDSYFKAFAREVISRESCYHCAYASTERVSDLTIADLWGYQYIELKELGKYDKTGISFLCVNSSKGADIFEEVKANLVYEKIDRNKAFSYNHYKNINVHPNRAAFMTKLESGQINEKNAIKNMRNYCGETAIRVYKQKVKRIIKSLIGKK